MKRTNHLLGKIQRYTTSWLGCAAALCLVATSLSAGDAKAGDAKAAVEDAVEYEEVGNWLDLTIGGPVSLSGDEAAFQRRTGLSQGLQGGIESMRYEKIADDLTFLVEGHALFGVDDYDLKLSLIKDDVGFLRAGFRHFRTFYDGSGGWVPRTDPRPDFWVPLVADELAVDRGNLWFEAGLRMENVPEITLSYSHQWRDGVKDSTSWAPDRSVTVALGGVGFGYGIVPTLNHINEKRDTINLDAAHTLGNTDIDLGMTYERVRNDNMREIHRAPRDTGTSTSAGTPIPNNRRVENRDIYNADLFNAHASTETRFNEKMLLSFAYAFTTMNTDTTGYERISTDVTGFVRRSSDHFIDTMTGGAEHQAHVANANFWWNPIPDLVIVPSIRAEWEDQSAISFFREYTDTNPGVGVTFAPVFERDSSESEIDNLTEQLDIRYTGIDNLVLYARGEYAQSDRDLELRDIDDDVRLSTTRVSQQKYTVGANWYPFRGVSLATQYYRRNWDQDYHHTFNPPSFPSPPGNGFDAQFLSRDFQTDDANLRITWRALPNLTVVGRYDYQDTEIQNRARNTVGNSLENVQSAKIKRNVFSGSVTWMPIEQVYVQGSLSYVNARTDTPANIYVPRRIADFDNDYVTANFAVGYALDRKTSIEASYVFYHSNNYEEPKSQPSGVVGVAAFPGSVPFGSDADEHMLSVTLNRQICPNVIWNLGYGFYASNDGTSGGHNDFTAHTLSTGVKIRF